MLLHGHTFNSARCRFLSRASIIRLLILVTATCAAGLASAAGADENTKAASEIRHSDLSVYRADDGTLLPIRTTDDWALRRKQIIAGAEAAMGTMPAFENLPPFDVQLTEDVRIGDVRRLTMTIVVEGSDRLPLDLYLPKSLADAVDVKDLLNAGSSAKLAAVVALHPTGAAGKRIVAGEGGKAGRQYGLELAQRGYVVIAPDYPSFGQYDKYDFENDKYVSGTMKGIFNHRRCVDFLSALKFVDADRIGVIGHSLGGHNAIFLGAFDERLKVIVSSCGWCPFHDYYGGDIKGWTSDRYMPRLRDVYESNADKVPFDFYELIAALAPRTFVSVSPVRDSNFDIGGVQKAIPVAGSIYALFKAREELMLITPDCEHDFPTDMRLQAYNVIDRVLKHTPNDFEPDFAGELPRIPAREPADAMASFHVIGGYEMQQTAAEPLLTDPVAMSFDADGRLFVAEMNDYSEQATEHLGRVRMLVDSDDDGRFDQSHVFATGLSWPTAIICANDGVFVAAAPDIFFLKDTDGDMKADVNEVVFTGFERSNVQGLINSFHWGPDNRIYGSASTVGGSITSPKYPGRAALQCRGRDFSFDSKTLELRAETGGGQHGMCFDDWGHRFVSANSDHAQMIVYRDQYLSRSPLPSAAPARVSIAVDGGQAPVFRMSPVEPWRIVRTRLRASGLSKGIVEGGGRPAGYFTGATGITIYRGDAWPNDAKGLAIVGDVGSNIVHRKRLTADGVIWTANRMDEGRELVASEDIWFRPVQFANAPDGCLQVLDMYREVIEHPASLPPEIKKHLDLTSGRDRGRLYRIAPLGWKPRPVPHLSKATTAELVALLEHPNSWHRDTASRLIFERQDASAVDGIRQLLRNSSSGLGRFHAIGSLEGLNALTDEDVIAGLTDSEAGVRERAVLASEKHVASAEVLAALAALTNDDNARVKMQLGFSLGEFPPSRMRQEALLKLLVTSGQDRWIRTAVFTSLGPEAGEVFESLAATRDAASPGASVALTELADLVARRTSDDAGWVKIAAVIAARADDPALQVRLLQAVFAANKAAQGSSTFTQLTTQLLESARTNAANADLSEEQRAAALSTFSLSTFAKDGELLLSSLESSQSPAVQNAGLATLLQFSDDQIATQLLDRWSGLTPKLAEQVRDGLLRRTSWAVLVLDAISAGRLPPTTLSPSDLQRLASVPDDAVRSRAIKLLESMTSSTREDVLRSYQVALTLKPDREKGAALFKQHCSVCHQIGKVGFQVGPNLATMKNRGPEAILTNVLDPNREVNPAWRDYIAVTNDGQTFNGVLIAESASVLTFRRAEAKETSVLRSDIDALRDTGRSLMPEGLEKNLDAQSMADLIAWLMTVQ
ncbi:MAG: alpha/beta fold hydrolase [Fuerstia sp.]|nr:alpha/beta fold hydrolase [Fuerstiella sp.]